MRESEHQDIEIRRCDMPPNLASANDDSTSQTENRTPPNPATVIDVHSSESTNEAGLPESVPAGSASEPAGNASEPAGGASEPAGGVSEPAGGASEPAGGASEPAGDASERVEDASRLVGDESEDDRADWPDWLKRHLPPLEVAPGLPEFKLVLKNFIKLETSMGFPTGQVRSIQLNN
jgi:hypothetical protein